MIIYTHGSRIGGKKLFFVVAVSILLSVVSVFSQEEDFDENDLFSDSVSIVDSNTIVNTGEPDILEGKSLGVSGEITASFQPSLRRRWFDKGMKSKDALFSAFVVGNLFLDARLPGGFKGFVSSEARYNPGYDSTFFGLRELFIDVNIKKRIYFRIGKQVLQWGRCYFWNPTDLINVEKKSFLQKIGAREGAYGLKIHIPFGIRANIYGFFDTRGVDHIDSISGTTKLEFLLGSTEMAVSIWGKRGHTPVYAYDVSTGFLDFLFSGEIALYQEFTIHKIAFKNGTPLFSSETEKWLPRLCAGISRYFTINGIPDRLMTTVEMYYNQPGTELHTFPIPEDSILNDTLSAILIANGLYEPNNFSRFYLSMFTTFSRFIMSDMSLYFNAIGNLYQRSAMVSAGVTYQNIHNYYIEIVCTGYLGRDKTEYTITGNGLQIQLTTGLSF